jgi:hypothetical protein
VVRNRDDRIKRERGRPTMGRIVQEFAIGRGSAKRILSYGASGRLMEKGQSFTHGLNEKARVDAIDGGLALWVVLLKELAN